MPQTASARLSLAQFVASPCSTPQLTLDEALAAFAKLGYRKFETFTSWCASRVDYAADPEICLGPARRHGMNFTSLHLPPIENDRQATVARAIQAARFARDLGVSVVLYKASSRENYIAGARPFLDGIAGLGVTPVLQNHVGTPITTLEDFQAVITGISDPRMKTLLEVGMFHAVGVSWQQGYELLGDSIALVHIKDQIGADRVPFGEGEVDFRGLFGRLQADGYRGDIVVEMEVCRDDLPRTLALLGQARAYCGDLLAKL